MSTMGWDSLLPAAMIGTDRHPGGWPSLPGPVGALLAQLPQTSEAPATALLRVAAVLSTCSQAGARGALWQAALPAPAPQDRWQPLEPGPVQEAARWALHEGAARLHHLVLFALAQAQRRLPTALLPQALELGRRSLALRGPLLPVLGECGRWLATQNPEWAYAAGITAAAPEEAQWSEGSLEQRLAVLQRERASDPAFARERLQRSLPELPARERAELAAALRVGLSLADEALLETLRSDRSREVRQAALGLLLQLPEAAHPRRAGARLAALMRQERVLLRKRWLLDAPQAVADDWKADQLELVRPQHDSLGERAWWLYQLVRQVPLGWWCAHTGLSPSELLEWARSTDWTDALLRGWRDVLFAAPDEAWCDALLEQWPPSLRENPSAVLALLSPARRERHLQRRLREAGESLQASLAQILAACAPGETLSRETSLLLTDRVRERAGHLNQDYALRAQLPELACALHPDTLDRLSALPRQADETPSCAEALRTTEQVLAVRRALLTLTPARTP